MTFQIYALISNGDFVFDDNGFTLLFVITDSSAALVELLPALLL